MKAFRGYVLCLVAVSLLGLIWSISTDRYNKQHAKNSAVHKVIEESSQDEEEDRDFEEHRIIEEAKEDAVDWTKARSLVGTNTCIKGDIVSQDDDREDGVYLYMGNNAGNSNRFQVFVPDDCLYRFADNHCDYYQCTIAVYGKVELSNGIPQITVRHPDDIVILR